MALGFNNYPVNWQTFSAGQDQRGQYLAQGINGITQGIVRYQERQREKKRNEQAVEMLKSMGPSMGLPQSILNDEKALKAGVDSIGAENMLQFGMLAGQMQNAQREQLLEQRNQQLESARLSEALSVYDRAVKEGRGGEAVSDALSTYVKTGGQNAKELSAVLGQAGSERRDETKANAASEDRGVTNRLKEAQIKESEARTQQMLEDEEEIPLGTAKPIEGAPGYTAIRTGPKSIQVIRPDGDPLTPEDRIRLQASIMRNEHPVGKYYNATRNEDGTVSDQLGSWGREKLNPIYEAIIRAVGLPAYTRDEDNKAVLLPPPDMQGASPFPSAAGAQPAQSSTAATPELNGLVDLPFGTP